MVKQTMINTMQNKKFDDLYTPVSAVKLLAKYLPPKQKVWECTDFGGSNITKVLREEGHEVVGSDIKRGVDFLETDATDFDFDCIITNPPYSLKEKFILKCYEWGKPFALLLPLTALEGINRGSLFDKFGISVIVINKRLDYTGKGSNWFNTSWFMWKILKDNTLVFEDIEKYGSN